MNQPPFLTYIFAFLLLISFWGCAQEKPTVTRNIPKDYESTANWTLPEGWEESETTSNMVMAAFEVISGEHNLKFTLSTFEGQAGSDLDNINRWLNQLGRPPIGEPQLQELKKENTYGHHQFLYFDLTEDAPSPAENQLLTAILRVTNRSWFFKLQGHRDGIRQQEANFRSFLASFRLQGDPKEAPEPDALTKIPSPPPPPPATIPRLPDPRFTAALSSVGGSVIPAGGNLPPGVPPPPRSAPPPPPGGFPKPPPIPPSLLSQDQQQNPSAVPPISEPGQPEPDSGKPKWTVPAGWKSLPSTAFRVGNFMVQGENGDTGEVTVIPLSGGAGSLDANVLRWGRQIGIAPEDLQADPPKQQDVQISGQSGKYVSIQGEAEGIHIAMVKHNGQTWFFKLKGKHALVEAHKAAFNEFLQSVQF